MCQPVKAMPPSFETGVCHRDGIFSSLKAARQVSGALHNMPCHASTLSCPAAVQVHMQLTSSARRSALMW